MRCELAVLGICVGLLAACKSGSNEPVPHNDTSQPTTTSTSLEEPPPVALSDVPFRYEARVEGAPASARFQASGLPEWASINPETGVVSGTPGSEDVTSDTSFTITALGGQQKFRATGSLRVQHSAAFEEFDGLDFNATDYEGQPRQRRNDLTGELAGEVQFVQSHSIRPSGNYQPNRQDETQSIYQPDLVALRESLLLLIPADGVDPMSVDVEVLVKGDSLGVFAMRPPKALPESDNEASPKVEYSTEAWSVVLPPDVMRNGLSLRFKTQENDGDQRAGRLPTTAITIGEASQLVLQSIRLGMLTDPERRSGQYTLNDPVAAASDYFQTIPVSRLVMGSYADIILDRVILRDGTIHTDQSDDEGGIYSGDMRGDVAKSQVSVGVNLANAGIPSHDMTQHYPHVFKQITNHFAWGHYSNGRVQHGLSGGNGIGTLTASAGNEASHEWGHAFGLGHFPGKDLTADGRWQRHHADSGWGYIAHRRRMRDNLKDTPAEELPQPHGSHFDGRYEYRDDAMSGGGPQSAFSRYTHHTGFSARLIQSDLEDFPIPDAAFPTGYKQWNTATGQYEAASTGYPGPEQTGVPVATILGGYEPNGDRAIIYPVFHGNYGNVFELPAPDMSSGRDACWVRVANANGSVRRVKVAETRHHAETINQLHFNLPATFRPTSAAMKCQRNGTVELLTQTTFDPSVPELPPAVVVGQERGFKQLRKREMATLSTTLESMANEDAPMLDRDARIKVASYTRAELEEGLSEAALAVLDQAWAPIRAATQIRRQVNRMDQSGAPLDRQAEVVRRLLTHHGLPASVSMLVHEGGVLQVSDKMLSTTTDANDHLTLKSTPDDSTEAVRWIMDSAGRLHPVATPWQCLTPADGRLALAGCNGQQAQSWKYDPDTDQLKNAASGKCVDYAYDSGGVVLYRCHGNWNQQWQGVARTDQRMASVFGGAALRMVYERLLE